MRCEVRAVRWDGGWELHIPDVGVTQVRMLDAAEAQVRDYLATLEVPDADTAEVVITPEVDAELDYLIRHARNAIEEATRLMAEAATERRQSAQKLRDAGLSVSDTATVMGVSRGRVSQLLADA